MGCESGDWPLKYLGLPLEENPKAVEFWVPVLEKVRNDWMGGKNLVFLGVGG